jgi:uncharacterized protein (DUF1697 family)
MPVETYVALLRGINVGGKNMLPMKDLAAMFTAAGCQSVTTYIQSGNVIFQAKKPVAAKVSSIVNLEIENRYGFPGRMLIRSTGQMRAVALENPFLKLGVPLDLLSVMFLETAPGSANVASLDPDRSPPDTYIVAGDNVFLNTPNGLAKTKLTNAYFDSKLKTFSTIRNWRTVLKLLELMEAATKAV